MLLAVLVASSCATPEAATLVEIGAGLRGPERSPRDGLRDRSQPCVGVRVRRPGTPLDRDGRLHRYGRRRRVCRLDHRRRAAEGHQRPSHAPGPALAGRSPYVASKERVDAYGNFDGRRSARRSPVVTFEPVSGRSTASLSDPTAEFASASPRPATTAARPRSTPLQSSRSCLMAPISEPTPTASARPSASPTCPAPSDLFVTMNQRDDLGEATPGDWLGMVPAARTGVSRIATARAARLCRQTDARSRCSIPTRRSSGVAIVPGELGGGVGTSAIVAEWATGAVLQVALTRTPTGYSGTVRPLLTGLENPVPVLLDPTGGMVVGDWNTGTVYRIFRG